MFRVDTDDLQMEHDAAHHLSMLTRELNKGFIGHAGFTHELNYDRWLNDAAGTELYDRLGWGWQGWKLWWNDHSLFKMLMDGVDTPFAMRLFVTQRGRKSWPGARQAIEKANKGT